MPEESKWPEPALFFQYEGVEQAIGIESKASPRRLAQAIHDAGVPVRLDGWQPSQESEFEKAFFWQADPKDVGAEVLDGIEAGVEDIYPGDMAKGVSQGLAADPKSVEKEMGGYLPG